MKLVKNHNFLGLFVGIFGFLAVAIGAFGAHGLKPYLTQEMSVIFETGNKYHFYHTIMAAISLVFVHLSHLSNGNGKSKSFSYATILFLVGILFFSFSLYSLAISGVKVLGAITPIGGVFFLIGWTFFTKGIYSFFVPK
ncbi:DUF423 domain-containing protein [Leptospira sp. 96542]|nr:DUF423 domain-containing protein [Leptospira sp. 96542]